jgi:hypothetical protein
LKWVVDDPKTELKLAFEDSASSGKIVTMKLKASGILKTLLETGRVLILKQSLTGPMTKVGADR